MSESVKISVLVPIYKPDAFFIQCVESLLNQTYLNLEIIISDDSAYELPNEFLCNEKIRYIKNNSGCKGIFGNLNNALSIANGEYLQIFCQDDIMFPNLIKEQISLMLEYPDAGMVFCNYKVIDAAGGLKKSNENSTKVHYLNTQCALKSFFFYGCLPGNLSTVMVKSSVVKKVGVFKQEFAYAGDFEYWIRIAQEYPIVFNEKSLVFLRHHQKQASFTLEHEILVKDLSKIFKTLYSKVQFTNGKFFPFLYVNETIGVQHFLRIVKSVVKGKFENLKTLKHLSNFPFNIIVIMTLCIPTLCGKIKVFKKRNFLHSC